MTKTTEDYTGLFNAIQEKDPYGFGKEAAKLIHETHAPQQTASAIYAGLSKFPPQDKIVAMIKTYHAARGTGDLPIKLEQDLKDALGKISNPMAKLNTASFIYSSIRDTDTLKDYMSDRVIEAFEKMTARSSDENYDKLDFAYKTFTSNTTHAPLKNYMRRVVTEDINNIENIQGQTDLALFVYETCHEDREMQSSMLSILRQNMNKARENEQLLDEDTFESVASLLEDIEELNTPKASDPPQMNHDSFMDNLNRLEQ